MQKEECKMKKKKKIDSYEQMRARKEQEAIWGRNLCLFFVVVSVFMAIAISFERSNRTTQTQGEVIKKFSEEVKHFNPGLAPIIWKSTDYIFVLEFEDGGRKWEDVRVSKDKFDEVNIGDVLDISIYWSNGNYDIKLR